MPVASEVVVMMGDAHLDEVAFARRRVGEPAVNQIARRSAEPGVVAEQGNRRTCLQQHLAVTGRTPSRGSPADARRCAS